MTLTVPGETKAEDQITPVESQTRILGRQLFESMSRNAGPWRRAWWEDRLMALTLSDPATKVQLFRFVDALPMLKSPDRVRRHLDEYLNEAGDGVPTILRLPLNLLPHNAFGDKALAAIAHFAATRMAWKFIAGSTPAEAFATIKNLRRHRLAFTADLLGEAVISDAEADAYQKTCVDLLRGVAARLAHEPEVPLIDRGPQGPMPRVNLSLKLTSLTPWFDPLHAEATTRRVLARLRPILRAAREVGGFVNVDMEQYAFKDLTYAIFREVMLEPEFRDWANVGIVCQAYLPEAHGDLEMLRDWVETRGTPISIRLVKGAYWDYEVLHARQVGWPVPVYLAKWATDANYERCAHYLIEHRDRLRPALGSHNIRSVAHALAFAESRGAAQGEVEIQVLHGMGEPLARALAARGVRVRVYTPYGAMLPGMAYLVRRLLENTSNESFLKASTAGKAHWDDLLRDPEEYGRMFGRLNRTTAKPILQPQALPAFQNEPPTDFSRVENRLKMQAALASMRDQIEGEGGGLACLPVVAGHAIETDDVVNTLDPSDHSRVVAATRMARVVDAEAAVAAARAAFPKWSHTSARERAEVLLRAAEIFRQERFTIAATEVYECGKPWREADGDVAEAIDFCEFYARRMIELAEPRRRDVPGETNEIEHVARGVAVVIPPWNFPLAIPTGMTVAALVAGNTVVLKPAEQSPLTALALFRTLYKAGLPVGVLNFLPGRGVEVGQTLVNHPEVDLIAFTGSRAVGLAINRQAAEPRDGQDHVKRVIAEMGGKNAIIVDDDADLDEAVVGTIYSAFGYAGQKCSAASRVIVLERVYDAFLARLVEAARAIPVGPAEDPETVVGPVINERARARILGYIAQGEREGRVAAAVDIGTLADRGSFVAPRIYADVAPSATIAQEEIFGPVLAVIRVADIDEAIKVANGTNYALTGGLYSRSPAHIHRVKLGFRVGNLYINRPITGALVDRQPFGGFKLSGIGSKAGGVDYLLEFLLTRTVTENTLRRGFAPEEFSEDFNPEAVRGI